MKSAVLLTHGFWPVWSCLLVWLSVCGGLNAQEPANDSAVAPPAPQSHVLDDAELFRDQAEGLAEVQNSLRRMEKDHDYPVYLAVYYNVYDGNLQSRADDLYAAWIGKGERGMVIAYQLDPVVSGNNPAIAFFKGSSLDVDPANPGNEDVIPGRDVEVILGRVFEGVTKDKENHAAFISDTIFGIDRELEQYFKVEPVKWSDADNVKLMTVFLGVIIGLTLLGMLLWKLLSKADAKSNKEHYFPEVRVGRRLDAPFGGGWISEKTFVPASSRK